MTIKDIKHLKKDIDKFLLRVALELQKEVIINTPVDDGRLRNSISVKKDKNGYIIGTTLDYALYIEFGTGIYGPRKKSITPIRAKALHWIDKRTKKDVFAKEVKGFKPFAPFSKAVAKADKIIDKEFKEVFK